MKWLKRLFRRKPAEKLYKAYLLVIQGKSEYANEEFGMDTCVIGYMFRTYDDAIRHSLELKKYETWQLYEKLGVVEINTTLPITVATMDYERTEEHPSPTATFGEPDIV